MEIRNISLQSKVDVKLFHLAIGNFDGVHLGHQQIIKTLVNNAKKNDKHTAILSFNPHPRRFFSKDLDRYQIISEDHKKHLLKDLGIDYYFSLHFDQTIANLSPSEFIEKIIVQQLHVDKLIVGYDFRFGKNREGDIVLLQDHAAIHGFALEIIEPIKDAASAEVYSSTGIRKALQSGDVEKANSMLGRAWTMTGKVVHGDKRAGKMNFPTANILPHSQVYPKKGVYAIHAIMDEDLLKGIANFGERPTVDGKKLLLEVNLFDFDRDIYGKQLTVKFLRFIREEKKFDTISVLKDQITEDIHIAKNYHLRK